MPDLRANAVPGVGEIAEPPPPGMPMRVRRGGHERGTPVAHGSSQELPVFLRPLGQGNEPGDQRREITNARCRLPKLGEQHRVAGEVVEAVELEIDARLGMDLLEAEREVIHGPGALHEPLPSQTKTVIFI